tara:strand:- start:15556 stop:16116 length:561 start_codon:yes stop_codon:yes gene_type:complete
MAIEKISVVHSDLERRGGLKHLGVCLFSDITSVAFDSAANHTISTITESNVKLFELKQGTGSLTSTGTKEGGTILFEHTISAYIPNMSDAHMSAIDVLSNENLVVFATDFNDVTYVVGLSNKYSLTGDIANDQMYARLSGVEAATGAALGDENGVTLTFTATSGELPYLLTPAVTIDASDGSYSIA